MTNKYNLNWEAVVTEAKRRRRKLKISQEQLAFNAKLCVPSIIKFEQGCTTLRLSTIFSILMALGMAERPAVKRIPRAGLFG